MYVIVLCGIAAPILLESLTPLLALKKQVATLLSCLFWRFHVTRNQGQIPGAKSSLHPKASKKPKPQSNNHQEPNSASKGFPFQASDETTAPTNTLIAAL